jgi:hypothetical protein
MKYAFDPASGTYKRFHGETPHTLADGPQVSPVNVIFQTVQVVPGTVRDVNGQLSPESRVIGEGEAVLLRGGRALRGRWTRPSLDAPTNFVDVAGNPLLLARGQTWVELIPQGRSIVLS